MQPVSENNGYDFVTIAGNMSLPDGKQGSLDYYIRDYQQNVRMILTEETHIGSNQATMETGRAAGEEALFGQTGSGNEVAVTRFQVNNIPGQSVGDGWSHPDIGSQVSRLGALAAKKTGPNALLKVMSGDEISSFVQYYYKEPVSNGTGNNLLTDVLGSLISAISGSAVTTPGVKDGATNIGNNLNGPTPFADAVAPDANNPSGNNPKAYLNILFFNERFEFVQEGSTAVRVQGAGNGQAPLLLTNIKVPKNGYCYVYLSNESNEPVYFDNFKVTHSRGRIIEEDHYYAYGLKIAAISSTKVGDAREGHLQNKYGYQGAFSEMDDDIGWNDFALRNYDAQIGRWVQQDPYQEFPSPYTSMGSDPVNNIDPNGGETLPFLAINWSSALGSASGIASTASTAITTLGNASKVMSLATLTMSVLNVVNTTCTLINTDVTTSGVGTNQASEGLSNTSGSLPIFWDELEFPAIAQIDWEYYETRAPHSQKISLPPYSVLFLRFRYNGGGQAAINNRDASKKTYTGPTNPNGMLINRHEVPYATTMEGGAPAYSRLASAIQNQLHGVSLGIFYKKYGLIAGDYFYVPVIDPSKPRSVPQPVTSPEKYKVPSSSHPIPFVPIGIQFKPSGIGIPARTPGFFMFWGPLFEVIFNVDKPSSPVID